VTSGGGAVSSFYQQLLTTSSWDAYFAAKRFQCGVWVWCASASAVRAFIDDGVTRVYSGFHTGASVWEFLTLPRLSDAASTKLWGGCEAIASAVYYASGPTFLWSDIPPVDFCLPATVEGNIAFGQSGSLIVATDKDRFPFGRPAIVREIMVYAKTAPVTSAATFDVKHWDGSAYQNLCASGPGSISLAAAAKAVAKAPDGTYRYRCFRGLHSTTDADTLISWDAAAAGGTAAADVKVSIRTEQYLRPLEIFLGVAEES
jgi:hypothetical protein